MLVLSQDQNYRHRCIDTRGPKQHSITRTKLYRFRVMGTAGVRKAVARMQLGLKMGTPDAHE